MPEGLTETDLSVYEDVLDDSELRPALTACIDEIRRCWTVISALTEENGQLRLANQQLTRSGTNRETLIFNARGGNE